MKKAAAILIALVFVFLFSGRARAEETDSLEDEISRYTGMDRFAAEGENEEYLKKIRENDTAGFFETLLEGVYGNLTLHAAENRSLLAKIGFLILAAALWKRIRDAFSAQKLTRAFDLVFQGALVLICYRALSGVTALCGETLNALQSFLTGCIPVWTALATLGGKVQTAVVQNSNLLFAFELGEALCVRFLFPLFRILFAFHLLGAVSDLGLGSAARFVQNFVRRGILLLFTVLAAMLTFQNALAQASDGVMMRGVRFAAGNFIPVVGNLVGESAKTLAAGVTMVRSECGVLCLFLLLSVLLPPILRLFGKKIVFALARFIGELLNEEKAVAFLKGLSGILDLMIALMISCGIYFLYAFFLMIKTFGA